MTEFFAKIAQQVFDRALNISLGLLYEKPPKVNKVDLKNEWWQFPKKNILNLISFCKP